MRLATAAVIGGALLAPAPVAAQDPAPATPEWYAREAGNVEHAQGRTRDWGANPTGPAPGGIDPARAIERWDGQRGEVTEIEYRNRYRALIRGHLWRPKNAGTRPRAAVVFVNGYGSGDDAYHWAAQDLAEHGYVVMTFDPQGSGRSESEPAPEFCQPGGAWTQPQEMGIREQGRCAGQDPDDTQLGELTALGFVATGKLGDEDARATAPVYRKIAPRFVFGTLDAVDFLLSERNPWRSLVDARRVGVAGHSAGAWASLMVANGDPRRRFHAAVAMDGYHGFDFGVRGRAPTLVLQGEQQNVLGPRTVPPKDPRSPDQLHAMRGAFSDLRARGIATGFYVLRGSTHAEFTDQLSSASSKGQRVATQLTLAWLDRHLRDGDEAAGRLRAERFDGSADASSIGTGRYDGERNVPPVIAGERMADHLSFYYPSDLFDGGQTCLDLRVRPCPVPSRATSAPGAAAPAARCASRRVFDIRVRGRRLRSAAVTVDGRAVRVRRRGSRLIARVDLRGLPPRVVPVRVVARTRSGRTVRERRTYRTCRLSGG